MIKMAGRIAAVVTVSLGAIFIACSSGGPASTGAGASPVLGCGSVSRGLMQVSGLVPSACYERAARLTTESPLRPEISAGWVFSLPVPYAAVTLTPALINPSYPSSSTNDTIYFGADTSRGTNFYAVNGLGGSSPATAWSYAASGAFDGSWVTLDGNNQVYAEDSTGALYCFGGSPTATDAGVTSASLCTGWSSQSYTTGNGSSLTSPWWDFDTNAVFFADGAGILHKIAVTTGTPTGVNAGAQIWSLNLNSFLPSNCNGSACPTFGIRSSPVVYNHIIYVGNDGGAFFQITDPATGTTAPTSVASEWLCGSGSVTTTGCGSAWSVLNAATLDTAKSEIYAAANGEVFEYPLQKPPTATHDHAVSLGASGSGIYSSPTVDNTNLFLYVGYNNQLHKIPYPFTATTADLATTLAGTGPDATYPRSSPLPFNGRVYIGNGAGFEEEYQCVGSASGSFKAAIVGQTQPVSLVTGSGNESATSVDSTGIVDFLNGNVDFGVTADPTSGSLTGGVAEYAQTSAWGCGPSGAGTTCSLSCGDTGSTTVCLANGGCCTVANCGTAPAHATYACTSNVCVLGCTTGYYSCGSQCIAKGSCCSTSNCTAAQPACPANPGGTTCTGTTGASSVCSGVGGTCGSAETVTLKLVYPSLSAITKMSVQYFTPTNTYTGSVTFTNNSTSVTGGTSFNTQFVAGQSVSSDGVNYYPIASVTSSTITLVSAYPQPTTTAGTYYEADCVAGQACPTTQTLTPSLSGATCSTTGAAGTGTETLCTLTTSISSTHGAFAITATASDVNGNAQAANVNPNKILLTGSGDLTSPVLNLVQVFPIGNGSNARCPLNLAADWSGTVWSVNGQGLGDSSCPSATNNISKLVPASAGSNVYNPTVYSPALLTASPEFIATTDSMFGAGDTSGDIWVTAPNLTDGIFRLSSTGVVRSGFPVGGCTTPRGIDNDPTQSPNGAFIACYGTTAAPPATGGRQIIELKSTGGVANSFSFTDSAAQPVTVTFPRAYTQNSSTVYDTDYECNSDVFVNRSSNTSAVISLLNGPFSGTQALQASSLNTYTQSASVDTTSTLR